MNYVLNSQSLPFYQDKTNDYCQKCKREIGFCPHKMQQTSPAQDTLKYPLTRY